jgi:hypothetical protein
MHACLQLCHTGMWISLELSTPPWQVTYSWDLLNAIDPWHWCVVAPLFSVQAGLLHRNKGSSSCGSSSVLRAAARCMQCAERHLNGVCQLPPGWVYFLVSSAAHLAVAANLPGKCVSVRHERFFKVQTALLRKQYGPRSKFGPHV